MEHELILEFRKIWYEYLQRVAVDQIRVQSEFDPKAMILDLIDIVQEEKERSEILKDYLQTKNRKPKK